MSLPGDHVEDVTSWQKMCSAKSNVLGKHISRIRVRQTCCHLFEKTTDAFCAAKFKNLLALHYLESVVNFFDCSRTKLSILILLVHPSSFRTACRLVKVIEETN